MLLDHDGGITSIVDCSYATRLPIEPFPRDPRGGGREQGHLAANAGLSPCRSREGGYQADEWEPPVLSWASPPWHNIQESVALIQQHWIEALRPDASRDTSGRDNLETFALVEASYLSAGGRADRFTRGGSRMTVSPCLSPLRHRREGAGRRAGSRRPA